MTDQTFSDLAEEYAEADALTAQWNAYVKQIQKPIAEPLQKARAGLKEAKEYQNSVKEKLREAATSGGASITLPDGLKVTVSKRGEDTKEERLNVEALLKHVQENQPELIAEFTEMVVVPAKEQSVRITRPKN